MKPKLLALAAAAATAAALAVPALAATRTIKVGDDYFVRAGTPPTVTVKKGTTVKWVWRGKVIHNVVARSGPQRFRSKTQVTGSFAKRFTKRGTYNIVCEIHTGMAMKLKVT
ncbi:MAG TPA: plastocyanin/azurin family copper-binding protein [Gaiellales bacterium]|nr:plastocyanin/azurin family copper-binding protein [Gaiellales bacterium]